MKRNYQLILALAIFVTGCTMRFIATHDPAVEGAALQLQSKFTAFFDDLQNTAGTPEGEYERYAAQYADLHAQVGDLQAKAALQSRNQLTNDSLTLLEDNLDILETAHREGLSAAEVPVLRKLIDTQVRMLVQLEVAKKREPLAPKREAVAPEVTP